MACPVQSKSSLLSRLAASSIESFRSRPSRVSLTSRANSSDVGDSASWATASTDRKRLWPARKPSCQHLQGVPKLILEFCAAAAGEDFQKDHRAQRREHKEQHAHEDAAQDEPDKARRDADAADQKDEVGLPQTQSGLLQ